MKSVYKTKFEFNAKDHGIYDCIFYIAAHSPREAEDKASVLELDHKRLRFLGLSDEQEEKELAITKKQLAHYEDLVRKYESD